MHGSRTARTFDSVRRDAFSKICALWVVSLILIPFTAPFKTYELASSRTDHGSHDGLPKDKIATDEKAVSQSDHSRVPPTLDIVDNPFTRPHSIEAPRLQPTVLRL